MAHADATLAPLGPPTGTPPVRPDTHLAAPRSDNLIPAELSASDFGAVEGAPDRQPVPAPARNALALAPTGAGLPAHALAAALAPLRPGDPLGLGVAPDARPAPPPDPDPYDRAREDAEYARSLLGAEERAEIDADVARNGYMQIDEVRALVAKNTAKGSVEAGGLDPEVLTLIDARVDYKIFIAGDNLYTRSELYDHYPFHEFNVQPEAVFVQQEVGVFPPRKHALAEELEYVARDVGDESVDFEMIEDLVGRATRANYKKRRAPLRIAKTKIYVGKERWDDFVLMQRLFRGAVRVAAAQIACGTNADRVSPIFAALAGPSARPGLLALTDPATLEAERRARDEEAARRAEELRRREEELRQREEEMRRAAEAVQRKIDADLRRIEAMLAAAGLATAPTRKPPTTTGAAGAADAEDAKGAAGAGGAAGAEGAAGAGGAAGAEGEAVGDVPARPSYKNGDDSVAL